MNGFLFNCVLVRDYKECNICKRWDYSTDLLFIKNLIGQTVWLVTKYSKHCACAREQGATMCQSCSRNQWKPIPFFFSYFFFLTSISCQLDHCIHLSELIRFWQVSLFVCLVFFLANQCSQCVLLVLIINLIDRFKINAATWVWFSCCMCTLWWFDVNNSLRWLFFM